MSENPQESSGVQTAKNYTGRGARSLRRKEAGCANKRGGKRKGIIQLNSSLKGLFVLRDEHGRRFRLGSGGRRRRMDGWRQVGGGAGGVSGTAFPCSDCTLFLYHAQQNPLSRVESSGNFFATL